MSEFRGKLIAGFGLPGSGKSSVMAELARQCGWESFFEPEEGEWARAVRDRKQCGYFTALTWFRAARVPLLYEADRLRRAGAISVMDSYYDKLVVKYLGKKGMEWLLPPDDPYFNLAFSMAEMDYATLPDCDCLVYFQVDRETWCQYLSRRNRMFDKENPLIDSYCTADVFKYAAEEYCKEKNIPLLVFENKVSTPKDAAISLRNAMGEYLA